MMLMKTPTSGGSATGTAGGRDVIFRLSVQPDASAPAKLRTWGEGFRKEQALFAVEGRRIAKEWGDAWSREFDRLEARSRATAQRMASDWSAAMRGIGSGGGGGPGPAGIGGGGSFAGLASASANINPWNRLSSANLTQWQRLAYASPSSSPMNMTALAGASGMNWSAVGGSPSPVTGRGGLGGSNRGLEALNSLLVGGTHFARGLAYSGAANEQDSQKVLETLLRMEGLLALIHGSIALGKGLGVLSGIAGLGIPAAAALGGIGAAGMVGNDIFGQANRSGSFTRRAAWWNPARWGYSYKNNPNAPEWYELNESANRADLQEKNLTAAGKLRQSRMAGDASEFATNSQQLSLEAAYRRRGQRGDAAEYASLGTDLVGMEKELIRLKQLEQESANKGEVELAARVRDRMQMEMNISDVVTRRQDIELRGEERRNQTALARAQNNLGLAQSRLSQQEGLTAGAVGRYRSDLSRFGAMSPLDRARAAAAFQAVRAGRASLEQEQIASQFNEYAPQVETAQAQRGARFGGGFFGRGASEASTGLTALDEARKMATAAAEQVNLNTKLQLDIQIKQAGGDQALQDFADQTVAFMKEELARRDKEFAAKLDEMQRQFNKQQVAKQIIAR